MSRSRLALFVIRLMADLAMAEFDHAGFVALFTEADLRDTAEAVGIQGDVGHEVRFEVAGVEWREGLEGFNRWNCRGREGLA